MMEGGSSFNSAIEHSLSRSVGESFDIAYQIRVTKDTLHFAHLNLGSTNPTRYAFIFNKYEQNYLLILNSELIILGRHMLKGFYPVAVVALRYRTKRRDVVWNKKTAMS